MAPGDRDEVTNGELMRALSRLESNSARIEGKVDRQGDTIAAVNLRLTVIEATQTVQSSHPEERRGGGVARPLGYGGLGATLLGLVQWMISQWKQ